MEVQTERKLVYIEISFIVGFIFGLFFYHYMVLPDYVNAQVKQRSDIEEKYNIDIDVNGKQRTYTYETLCTGYYTVDETGDKIVYTGHGDLSEKYTYEESLPIKLPSTPSTTPRF